MPDPLVARYLAALEQADVPAALALFAPDGVVHSPLYGILPAARFYPALFADTGASRLRLRRVMRADDEGTPTVAFWFDFDWVLANGEPAPFSVVDVAELDAEGRIGREPQVGEGVGVGRGGPVVGVRGRRVGEDEGRGGEPGHRDEDEHEGRQHPAVAGQRESEQDAGARQPSGARPHPGCRDAHRGHGTASTILASTSSP